MLPPHPAPEIDIFDSGYKSTMTPRKTDTCVSLTTGQALPGRDLDLKELKAFAQTAARSLWRAFAGRREIQAPASPCASGKTAEGATVLTCFTPRGPGNPWGPAGVPWD